MVLIKSSMLICLFIRRCFYLSLFTTLISLGLVNTAYADSNPDIEDIKKLVSMGAFSKARPKTEELLKSNPENLNVRLEAARLYKKMGLWSRSIAEYEWISKKYPDMPEPYIALSEMYLKFLSSDLALSLAREALYLAPDSRDAARQLISALIANRQYEEAGAELDRLVKQNPDDPLVMHLAFNIRKNTGDLKDAKNYLTKAIKLKPEKISWQLDLFEISFALRDYRSAKIAINTYLESSPDSIDALQKKAYFEETCLFDYKKAQETYNHILKNDHENWVAQAGIERLKKKNSDIAESIKMGIRKFFSDISTTFAN